MPGSPPESSNQKSDQKSDQKDQSSRPSAGPSSFWERLGQSASRGVQAAKELGSRVSEETSQYVDRKRAQERIARHEQALGRLVAKRLEHDGELTVSADQEEVRNLLDAIRRERAALEALDEASTAAEAPDQNLGGESQTTTDD